MYSNNQSSSLGDVPDNVIEAVKGLDPFERDALDYDSLPALDENGDFTIITQQGSEHVTHEGLIDMAHQDGLALTFTEPVKIPNHDERVNGKEPVVFRALVVTRRGIFTAYGDASHSDTMVDAIIRMAETRALSRALRQAVNVGSATAPEMPDTDDGVVVE